MFRVKDDEFFMTLSTNYAQTIWKIIGLEWDQKDPTEPEKKISLHKLKMFICKAEGYEKDMLALLYGTTGIMDLDTKTNYVTKANLKEVSDLVPEQTITAKLPASGRL